MTRYILLIVVALSLSACQTPSGGTAAPPNPSTIAMMEQSLTAAEKAAAIYVRLPLCSTTTRRPCSDAAVSAKIKAADRVAFDAVKAAQASSDPDKMTAAAAAIATLVALIPTN